jgi:hypothetical protein
MPRLTIMQSCDRLRVMLAFERGGGRCRHIRFVCGLLRARRQEEAEQDGREGYGGRVHDKSWLIAAGSFTMPLRLPSRQHSVMICEPAAVLISVLIAPCGGVD